MWSGNGFPGNSTTESGNRGSRKGIEEFSGKGGKLGCKNGEGGGDEKRGRRIAAGPFYPRLPASLRSKLLPRILVNRGRPASPAASRRLAPGSGECVPG